MKEHDQRDCPRCGAPAGDYRFCASCRSHVESLTGAARHATTTAAEADPGLQSPEEPIRLEQALVRLEQAMAAASRMSGDPVVDSTPATAVEVDDAPPPSKDAILDASRGIVDLAKLSPAGDVGAEPAQRHRDIARLEDVLTVAPPRSHDDTIEAAPRAAAAPELAPAEPEPSYVDAQALREAFWFEQASARQSGSAERRPGQDAAAAEAIVEPISASSEPAPAPQPASAPSVARLWGEERSTSSWTTALCLLALLALVGLLTGRAPRRVR